MTGTLFRRRLRTAHRWIGLLVFVQLVFWVGSGLIMSSLSLDEVRGEHLRTPAATAPLPDASALQPLAAVLAARPGTTAATLTQLLGQPVYRLETADGPQLVDALSGKDLSPLDEDLARRVALADYSGDAPLRTIEWVEQAETEFRGRAPPLWRAWFGDRWNTAVYVSPDTGQVVARRNDLWRVFDFVWMLHIMDYEEREDFNHPLLVVTAATALLFVLTGLFMLVVSFRARGPKPGA